MSEFSFFIISICATWLYCTQFYILNDINLKPVMENSEGRMIIKSKRSCSKFASYTSAEVDRFKSQLLASKYSYVMLFSLLEHHGLFHRPLQTFRHAYVRWMLTRKTLCGSFLDEYLLNLIVHVRENINYVLHVNYGIIMFSRRSNRKSQFIVKVLAGTGMINVC